MFSFKQFYNFVKYPAVLSRTVFKAYEYEVPVDSDVQLVQTIVKDIDVIPVCFSEWVIKENSKIIYTWPRGGTTEYMTDNPYVLDKEISMRVKIDETLYFYASKEEFKRVINNVQIDKLEDPEIVKNMDQDVYIQVVKGPNFVYVVEKGKIRKVEGFHGDILEFSVNHPDRRQLVQLDGEELNKILQELNQTIILSKTVYNKGNTVNPRNMEYPIVFQLKKSIKIKDKGINNWISTSNFDAKKEQQEKARKAQLESPIEEKDKQITQDTQDKQDETRIQVEDKNENIITQNIKDKRVVVTTDAKEKTTTEEPDASKAKAEHVQQSKSIFSEHKYKVAIAVLVAFSTILLAALLLALIYKYVKYSNVGIEDATLDV